MTERISRTLYDLPRGSKAHAVDVLRLALHYILRGGWTPAEPPRAGAVRPAMGVIDRAYSIEQAIMRARRELYAPWMRGLEATQEIRAAIGAHRESPPSVRLWEIAPGRTAAEVKDAFKRAILALAAKQKGLLVDVAA